MEGLIAQNGLKYSVALRYSIFLTTKEYIYFQSLFSPLITFSTKIFDEGFAITFVLNVDEEIGKFGRFKDIPTKKEIGKYKTLIENSDTFKNGDFHFLSQMIHGFIAKEEYRHKSIKEEIYSILNKIKNSLDKPEIAIQNLSLASELIEPKEKI